MYLKSYHLVLLALALAMFPRLFAAMGAPKIVNFMHFAFIPAIFCLAYPRIQPYCYKLLTITFVLFGAITLSAFVNESGFINIVLDFLLLAEPFLLLMIIVAFPWSRTSVERFRNWLLLFAFVNSALAYFQWFVLGLKTTKSRAS